MSDGCIHPEEGSTARIVAAQHLQAKKMRCVLYCACTERGASSTLVTYCSSTCHEEEAGRPAAASQRSTQAHAWRCRQLAS
jgi:hypothetical protein